MTIPTEKAYETLNLPLGASKDAIEQSYKKLALKWHPEKYTTTKNIQEAFKKFKSINLAYRKLIYNERDDRDITLHEMFEQYRQVLRGDNNTNNKKKEKLNSNGQTFLDIKNSTDNNNLINKNNSLLELNNNNNFINNKNNNTNNNNNINTTNTVNVNSDHFFGNEVNFNLIKNSKLKLINDKNNNNDEENYENQYQTLRRDDQLDQNILALKLKAKNLAIKGNELAKQNEFLKAIEKFSEALKYDSSDHRLYGNRSYCYDKINLFQEALSDAEKAILLEPIWPKGYFRKGRALYGLKMYKEAEQAYEKVLEIETSNEPDLEEELFKVRVLQLQEMGFSKIQSENAMKSNITVQAALESIFNYPKIVDKSNESCSDLDENEFEFDDNESENDHQEKKATTNANLNSINNEKSNSQQLQASTSLWIGNVDPNVTEETLTQMFSAHGPLANVRCLPEKYCAFVNFKLKEDAQKAMQHLQGKHLEGQRLLIKYPDNPNTAILSSLIVKKNSDNPKKSTSTVQEPAAKPKKKIENDSTTTTITISNSKTSTTSSSLSATTTTSSAATTDLTSQNGMKLSGPVNGNECYFWRTTGCLYADKCRYEHIKKNKGIDKKPWHK